MYLYLYVNIYKVFATRVALSKPNYIQIAKTDPSPNPSKRLLGSGSTSDFSSDSITYSSEYKYFAQFVR